MYRYHVAVPDDVLQSCPTALLRQIKAKSSYLRPVFIVFMIHSHCNPAAVTEADRIPQPEQSSMKRGACVCPSSFTMFCKPHC